MTTLNPALARVLKRLHYPLDVILTCVRWYLSGQHDRERSARTRKIRVSVSDLGHGCYAVAARHGFMEMPNVPDLLLLVQEQIPGWQYEPAETSFFLARDTILATAGSKGISLWRERLFAFMARNAAQAAEYYSLPASRVVEMGGQINL